MSQDADHLRLLSVFHYIVGGLTAFFACIPLIHLVFGLLMVFNPHFFGPKDQPPPFLGWFFVIFSAAFILAGWALAALIAWAGCCLHRRRHYTFCFVMACVACLLMPYGTVLGIFTLLVLLRPTVKALFGQPVTATR